MNFFTRLFGYLKNVVIAISLGLTAETDMYFLAISFIGLFLIFVDVFDSIGIPHLVDIRKKGDWENFYKFSALLLTLTTILAISLSILAFIVSQFITSIVFIIDEHNKSLLVLNFYLLIPYLFFNFFFHHFGAIHRSINNFSIYFLGEFIFSFFSLIFIILFLLVFDKNSIVLPISLSLAQIISTIFILFFSRKFVKFVFFWDNRIKYIIKQFSILTVLYGILHIFTLIDRSFATLLGEKNVSALSYGWMIATIPRGIFKLENILITPLSEVKGNLKKLNFYIKKIIFLFVPTSLAMFFLSPFFTKILFGYGNFEFLDFLLVSEAAKFYSLALPFLFLWPILYRVYQIKNKLAFLIFIALFGIITNLYLNYLFVIKINLGIKGICLGTFGAYVVLVIISYLFLLKISRRENNG